VRKPFLITLTLALAAYALLPMTGFSSSLDSRIGKARNQIAGKKAQESVLTTQLSSYSTRIQVLQGDIGDLQARQDRTQVSLNAKQAELTTIANRRQIVQDRLTRLRAKLVAGRALLANRLVALYKDQQPDMVSVVLESSGFTDLLDRAEFIQRISDQNEAVVTTVRDLTHQVGIETKRLQGLEAQATAARNEILVKRNQIAGAKQTLVSRQSDLVAAKDVRAQALASVRSDRHHLEGELNVLQQKQQAIMASLQGSSGSVSGGPIRRGSGQFIWPVNGPVVSGFGMRTLGGTTRMHTGVDIGVGTGTPIHAAAAGTVALMQPESSSGGYGNFTCIQHSGAISTCYAHQSRFGTSVGAHVSQGQVIGYVGCTGHCFGPHLHFEVRINGSPVDPMGYL
jgi:murein DD-endopeptidase MepM/ murein hydrolase activator NlpD